MFFDSSLPLQAFVGKGSIGFKMRSEEALILPHEHFFLYEIKRVY